MPAQPILLRPAHLLAASVFILSAADAIAAWPQYNGPRFDRTTEDAIQASAWPKAGPKVVWKAETPNGFSSFAVSGGKALTIITEEVDGVPTEVCLALDAATGKKAWSAPLGLARYDGGGDSGANDNKGGDGARSTPSISGSRAYVIDARLGLHCLDLASGDVVWTRDIAKDHGGENIRWQNAASPLIDGDRIFMAGGGKGQALIAVDKESGETLWAVEDDTMTHATPVAATIHDQRQIIFFTQEGLVSVTPEKGDVLWRHAFPFKISTAASPVVWKDIVYCSAGYGVGAGACRIVRTGDGFEAAELWRRENDLMNHWSTPVVRDGYLYGMFSFKEYGTGPLACVDLEKGEIVWKEAGFGPGNVVLAGDTLIALSDRGEIVAVDPNPRKYVEIRRLDVLDGKCWSTPVVADGRIYARSTKEAACLEAR